MFHYNKKLLAISISVTFAMLLNTAQAQYEVVHAKTIGSPQNKTSDYSFGFKDFDDTFSEEEYYDPTQSPEEKNYNFFDKFRKKTKKASSVESELPFDNENNSIQKHEASAKYENVEIDDQNKFKINAEKITYSETDGNVYANGNVEIISSEDKVTLRADNAVLEKDSQTLKLYDNVRVLKNGTEMSGEYLLIDFNEENVLMENPTYKAFSFEITAQEGHVVANDIEMINGVVKAAPNEEFALETRAFQRYENVAMDYLRQRKERHSDGTGAKQTYVIKAKNIILTSYKDHNSLTLKNSDLYYNNHKIIRNTDIEFVTDKKNDVKEINSPEAGTLRAFGTYVGYGFLHKLPKGHTLKLMPAIVQGDGKLGVGIVGRYRTQNGLLQAGYATSTTNLVARGRYKFGDGLELRYGRHAYMPEGFMGARRSGYAAQLQKTQVFYNDDLKIRFSHGLYAGLMSDYQKHDQEDAFSTTRFRYMAEIRKNLLRMENKEEQLSLTVNLLSQAAATLYGTGDTAGVARIGPYVTTRVKKWESSIGYTVAGVHGDSPFVFDKYRYGKSSIMINEKFNFNNKFSLGYRATISPFKDNHENDLLTESRLYAMMGPQDLKLVFSYDIVREIAHVDFLFIIGSDTSRIEFEKFSTKDFDGGKNKRDFYKSIKPKINTNEIL